MEFDTSSLNTTADWSEEMIGTTSHALRAPKNHWIPREGNSIRGVPIFGVRHDKSREELIAVWSCPVWVQSRVPCTSPRCLSLLLPFLPLSPSLSLSLSLSLFIYIYIYLFHCLIYRVPVSHSASPSRGSPRLRLVDILQIKSAPGMLATTRGLWDLFQRVSSPPSPSPSISRRKGRARYGRTQVERGPSGDPTAWDVIYGSLKTTVCYISGYTWVSLASYHCLRWHPPHDTPLAYAYVYRRPACASEDKTGEDTPELATSAAPGARAASFMVYLIVALPGCKVP